MNYDIKHAESKAELSSILDFASRIFGQHESLSGFVWEERMKAHPELIIYAEADGQVIGITPSFVEDNGNVTVSIVAVDENFRKQGVARTLMLEVEKEAKKLGVADRARFGRNRGGLLSKARLYGTAARPKRKAYGCRAARA